MNDQEWKVWFRGNFWGHTPDRTHPGREVPVRAEFLWNGHKGLIPAVYLCGRGVVADVCISAPAAEVDSWVEQMLAASPEEQEALARTGPLNSDYRAELTVNGRLCRMEHSCAVGWMPNPPKGEKNSQAAETLLAHYGLDPALGWSIRRFAIPWGTARRPRQLRSVTLTLSPEERDIPGPGFTAETGKTVSCTNPEGQPVKLTVVETDTLAMPGQEERTTRTGREYPGNMQAISYTLFPEQPEGSWAVRDRSPGDAPRAVGDGAARVGVIGGADGPVAIFLRSKDGCSTACSSAYFSEHPVVEWQLFFRRRPWEDVNVKLLIE